MSKKRFGAAVAAMCAAYLLWPYVTLYRLGEAIRHGDAATLASLVDWDGVREGIKEDICDNVFDDADQQQAASGGHLAPFGFSFVKGIAANVIDTNVTPQALVSASRPSETGAASGTAAAPPSLPAPRIEWAFFDGPTTFSVLLAPPGAPADQDPIRVQLALRHGAWKVTRAWLPRAMLTHANSRT